MSVQPKDARVLITGAGSGIGAATALRYAKKGAHVVAVDIDGDAAEAIAATCGSVGPAARAHACDVADAEAMLALADEVGEVDVLVNNAGVGIAGPFLDATLEDWEWLRSINLDGVVHGVRAFVPGMLERRRGHVVNIASGAAYIPHRSLAAYCATKSAVLMLSQCLRADWASRKVGVSVICPGVIDTPIAKNTRMVGRAQRRRSQAISALRMGHSPDLVAKAIVNAAAKNQDIVPVGIESTLAFRVLRLAPGPIQGYVARAGVI
ncbi:MAG TPA: SDR family NAD(P)-dependent oxidoreductase [Solirubrobacteraceae bacterium]